MVIIKYRGAISDISPLQVAHSATLHGVTAILPYSAAGAVEDPALLPQTLPTQRLRYAQSRAGLISEVAAATG